MFIYLIVNHVTGKYYVGQHKGNNLKKYLQQKFGHAKRGESSRSYLYNSMRKHPDHSVWSIHALLSDVQTKVELDAFECDFIAFLKSQDPEYGYNIARGGEGGGMLGHKHSLETIEKIRVANAGKQQYPRTPENEAKRIAGFYASVEERMAAGNYHGSQEAVDKIKEARARQDETFRVEKQKEYEQLHPERRARAAVTHTGKKHRMSVKGSAAISEAFRRTAHIRWHVNRDLKNPTCVLCK
jgi:hypothetical protein